MRRQQDQLVARIAQRLDRARQRVGRADGDLDVGRRDPGRSSPLATIVVDERRPAAGCAVRVEVALPELAHVDLVEPCRAARRCVSPICSGITSPGNRARCSRSRAKIDAGTALPAVDTEGNRDTPRTVSSSAIQPPPPCSRAGPLAIRSLGCPRSSPNGAQASARDRARARHARLARGARARDLELLARRSVGDPLRRGRAG